MENSKGENKMKTKTNKKSLLAIVISSALALMLSVATLFTLPTFSAKADAGQRSMTFNDVVQEKETTTLVAGKYYRTMERSFKAVSKDYNHILTYDSEFILEEGPDRIDINNQSVFNVVDTDDGVIFYLPDMASITNEACTVTEWNFSGENQVYELSLKDYTVKATAEADVIANRLIRVRRADGQPLYTEGDNFYFDGLSIGDGERLYISVRENKVCINNYEKDTVIALHRFEDNFMTYVDFYFSSEHYDGATLTYGHTSFNGDEYIFEELFLDVEELDTDNGAEEETNDGAEEEKDDFWQNVKDTVNGWGETGSEWLGDNLGVTISGSALIGAAIVAAILILLFRRRK